MLSVRRPTQTTVQYTVSTRSPADTIAARVRGYLLVLLRITTGILAARILLHEFRVLDRVYLLSWLENVILASPAGHSLSHIVSSINWIWRSVLCAAVLQLVLRKGFTEESLLVIRGLGVQTSTSSSTYFWTSSTRFIPTSSIQDIFIYEAFKGFEVKFYLSIVVEGEEDVVVVFPVKIYSPLHVPERTRH